MIGFSNLNAKDSLKRILAPESRRSKVGQVGDSLLRIVMDRSMNQLIVLIQPTARPHRAGTQAFNKEAPALANLKINRASDAWQQLLLQQSVQRFPTSNYL